MSRSDWIAAVAAAVTLPLFLWGQMPLEGVDLAHHYALVRVLMDEGIRTGFDANLGEMNVYPPLSHYLSAAVGFVTGSGLTAILAVAAGAVASLYVLLLSLIRSVSTTAALAAAVVLGVLVAGRIGLVPGSEVVGNFFFSQLVAYALAFTAIAAVAGYYRRHGDLKLPRDQRAMAVLSATPLPGGSTAVLKNPPRHRDGKGCETLSSPHVKLHRVDIG